MRLTGEGTTFRSSLRVEVRDDSLSPYGGAVLLREFEERTAFLAGLIGRLVDPRRACQAVHGLATLLRFAVYRIVLGLPDVTDADRLRHDPVLRACLAPEHQDRMPGPLPGKSTLHRFLTQVLTLRANRRVLRQGLIDSALQPLLRSRAFVRRIYVDLDSTEIEAHGEQQGARHSGHFRSTCFHQLSLSLAPYGTTLGVLMRPGNVHTAHHAAAFVIPILALVRQRLGAHVQIVLRADSGFDSPKFLRALERSGIYYIIRTRENARLLGKCERIAKRRPGRPSGRFCATRYFSFWHKATRWPGERWFVARSAFDPGELLPDWTLLCVHLPGREGRKHVVRTYLARGKSEQVHDIFKNEMNGSLMSHHRLQDNQVRAVLTALAQNLMLAFEAHVRRRKASRPATVRARILSVAASFVRHGRSLVMRLSANPTLARLLRHVADRVSRAGPVPELLPT